MEKLYTIKTLEWELVNKHGLLSRAIEGPTTYITAKGLPLTGEKKVAVHSVVKTDGQEYFTYVSSADSDEEGRILMEEFRLSILSPALEEVEAPELGQEVMDALKGAEYGLDCAVKAMIHIGMDWEHSSPRKAYQAVVDVVEKLERRAKP